MVKEERLRERNGRLIFASAGFRPAKKARFSIVMLKCEEGRVEAMQFAKVVVFQ